MVDDTADDIAQELPRIDRWPGWVCYLLEALEVKAMDIDRDHPRQYEAFLPRLELVIETRLEAGRW